MAKSLRQAIINAVRSADDASWQPGRLGLRGEDGSIKLRVAGSVNKVYVRRGAEGQLTVMQALNTGVRYLYDLPVEYRLQKGEWVVREDASRLASFTGNGAIGGSAPYHTHRRGTGLEYESEPELFKPGRVLHSAGMTVRIRGFFYNFDGDYLYFPESTLDLTSNKPGTAGQWRWVVVCMDPATNTPIAVNGTPQSTASPLDVEDIAAIDIGDYWPMGAVKVKNSDTTLGSADRYVDAHEWFNRPAGDGTFLGLSDTPDDYTGDALKLLRVNAGETAVEFATLAQIDAELAALAGLTSAADKLPYFTGPGTAALADFTAFARTLLDDADAATARATLGLVIGTNVQAFDAELAAIAGLTSAANKGIMFTGAGTAATYDLSAFALTLLDDAAASNARTTLGLGTIAVEAETNYLLAAGTRILSGDWDVGEDRRILLERISPRDSEGLIFYDSTGATVLGLLTDAGLLQLGWQTSTRTSPTQGVIHVEDIAGNRLLVLARNTNDANAPINTFVKSRGTAVGSNTIVQDGDELGRLDFFGGDGGGTTAAQGANIFVAVDGTPGNADMPARIVLGTSPDGSNTPVERLRITSAGRVRVGPSTVTPASPFHVYEDDSAVDATAGATIEQDGAGDAILQFLLTGVRRWVVGVDNDDTDVFAISPLTDLTNKVFRLTTGGDLKISGRLDSGSTSIPAGSATPMLYTHNGTFGIFAGTVTNASGTATTIIANGTGDVTETALFVAIGVRSGVPAVINTFTQISPVPDDTTLYNDGVNTWNIRCNADGSIDVRRTAGTGTLTAALFILWV